MIFYLYIIIQIFLQLFYCLLNLALCHRIPVIRKMQRSQNERVAVKCGPYSSIANPSIFENGPSGDCAPGSLGQLLEEIRSAVLMDRSFVTVQDRLSEEYDSDEDSEDGRTSPFNRFDSAKELVVVGTRRFYEGAGMYL